MGPLVAEPSCIILRLVCGRIWKLENDESCSISVSHPCELDGDSGLYICQMIRLSSNCQSTRSLLNSLATKSATKFCGVTPSHFYFALVAKIDPVWNLKRLRLEMVSQTGFTVSEPRRNIDFLLLGKALWGWVGRSDRSRNKRIEMPIYNRTRVTAASLAAP